MPPQWMDGGGDGMTDRLESAVAVAVVALPVCWLLGWHVGEGRRPMDRMDWMDLPDDDARHHKRQH